MVCAEEFPYRIFFTHFNRETMKLQHIGLNKKISFLLCMDNIKFVLIPTFTSWLLSYIIQAKLSLCL